jgi:hypothetical protein
MWTASLDANTSFQAARDELARAITVDRGADRSAIAAGSSLPAAKDRAEAKASAAAEQAQRRQQAAQAAWTEASRAFVLSVVEHLPEWRETQREQVDRVVVEVESLINELHYAIAQLASERITLATLDELSSMGNNIAVYSLSFGRVDERTARIQRAVAQENATVSGNLRHLDAESLLSALALLVDPPVQPRPVVIEAE